MSPIDISKSADGRNRTRGVAADELRRHNLSVVLERLHLSGPVSRSELTAGTGLNRSTIAYLIGGLVDLGLVDEGPSLTAAGPGRPSPMVKARPEGATVLAIDLAVDSIAVATLGLGGHVYDRLRVGRPRGRFSPQETVEDVVKLAEPMLDSLPGNHILVGVGAAVAGVVRRSDGFVHLAPNLGWRNTPLAAMLAAKLELSGDVLVANDADLGALAEHRRGVGRGVGHLIYISGEVGIGIGVILDGKPLLGSAGYAGEAGHTLINPDGQKCRCGATGCWETEAGEAALIRHAGLSVDVTGLGALETVLARATVGDASTIAAIHEVGRWLGLGAGNLINVFNPELVVLGGHYHRLFAFLQAAVVEAARTRTLDAPGDMATIAPSGLGSDAPLIGAAELAFSGVIADPAAAAGHSVRGGRATAKATRL
ncbi:MAG: ROK family protein [Acidimicrobiia bacterium]